MNTQETYEIPIVTLVTKFVVFLEGPYFFYFMLLCLLTLLYGRLRGFRWLSRIALVLLIFGQIAREFWYCAWPQESCVVLGSFCSGNVLFLRVVVFSTVFILIALTLKKARPSSEPADR